MKLIPLTTLDGGQVNTRCPSFCTTNHLGTPLDWAWHEGPAFQLVVPAPDDDPDGPRPTLWATLSAESFTDGSHGTPYIAIDAYDDGGCARLNVAQADQLIRDLKVYTARLQQLRDHLATAVEEDQR